MPPTQRYQSELDQGRLSPDLAQAAAVAQMQSLYDELVAARPQSLSRRLLARLAGRGAQPLTGLYLWGSVGSGKTCLVDMLYECLPFDNKLRVHFHRYMQWVHVELKQLTGVEAPLKPVARKLAGNAAVLCFDEFHVADITDAMLLSGLLHELFSLGVTLIATSNEHPDKLYWNGLQRERLLPAIELLKQHTHVLHLDTGTDYRLRYLDQARVYHCPADAASAQKLAQSFARIASGSVTSDAVVEIAGRELKCKRVACGVVWFDFTELCDGPRGVADYIELARQFQTVLVEGVPCLDDMDNDRAKRLITMVDEFYDRNVKLIVSAQALASALYRGQRLAREFARTASRLIEMQSHEYLGRPHLCG